MQARSGHVCGDAAGATAPSRGSDKAWPEVHQVHRGTHAAAPGLSVCLCSCCRSCCCGDAAVPPCSWIGCQRVPGLLLMLHIPCDHVPILGWTLPCRFVVYELVPPAAGTAGGTYSSARQLPHPQLLAQTEVPDASSTVNGMAWVGGQLAVCAGMRYLLVSPFGPPAGGYGNGSGGTAGSQWQELLAVPQDLAYSPAMLAAVPELGRAVLVVVS